MNVMLKYKESFVITSIIGTSIVLIMKFAIIVIAKKTQNNVLLNGCVACVFSFIFHMFFFCLGFLL
ncbi:hypothetical protein DRJ25_00900 [Candidatus Woesearchaeota archaeon]|nr:MAG: hypothetical protein DRJ25_00900 [Candidatus Woesearchaeota archaeon]